MQQNIFELNDDEPKVVPPPKGEYVIKSITSLLPGFMACYDDVNDPDQVNMFPVIGIALVELKSDNGEIEQVVRHLVSTPMGQIDDITEIPNFVCIVGPGQDPGQIIPAVKAMRAQAG